MDKKYSDDIRHNDDADFTMTIEGDLSEPYKMLGIEVPEKNVYTDKLKAACDAITEGIKNLNRLMTEAVERYPLVIRVRKEDIKNDDVLRQIDEQEKTKEKDHEITELNVALDIAERYNMCYHSTIEDCAHISCHGCKYYTDPDYFNTAVNQLAEYVKKSLNDVKKIDNRYIHNVTGGVELYDDDHKYVGYVHGFKVSEENEAILRSIVQSSWGLVTFNPFTLEKIIGERGFIPDLDVTVEMYTDHDHVSLPKHGYYKSCKVTEEK